MERKGRSSFKYPHRYGSLLPLSLILLLAAMRQPAFPQILKTFMAEFQRDYSTPIKQNISKGKIFYEAAADKLLMEVETPIHQWMLLQGNETIIYYPETNEAFHIKSRNEALIPFFKILLNCFKEDFGLSQQGYTLAHYEKKGTVLLSTWNPPDPLSKLLGTAILEYDANRVMRVEYTTPKGDILSRATFHQHAFVNGYYFPIEVSLLYKSKDMSMRETVVFVHPQFDKRLPAHVQEYKVPLGAKVKDIEW